MHHCWMNCWGYIQHVISACCLADIAIRYYLEHSESAQEQRIVQYDIAQYDIMIAINNML